MSLHENDSEYYCYSDEEREVLPEKRNTMQGRFDREWRHQRREQEAREHEEQERQKEQQRQKEQEVDKKLHYFIQKYYKRNGIEKTTTEDTGHRRTSAGAGIARFQKRNYIPISKCTWSSNKKNFMSWLKKSVANQTAHCEVAKGSRLDNIISSIKEAKTYPENHLKRSLENALTQPAYAKVADIKTVQLLEDMRNMTETSLLNIERSGPIEFLKNRGIE